MVNKTFITIEDFLEDHDRYLLHNLELNINGHRMDGKLIGSTKEEIIPETAIDQHGNKWFAHILKTNSEHTKNT